MEPEGEELKVTTWKYWKLWDLPPPLTVGALFRESHRGEFQMKYWKRWIGPLPLRVGFLYRASSAGEFQTWRDGQWVTIEARRMYDETMADEITEAEANRLALDL